MTKRSTYEVGQIHEVRTPFIVEDREIPSDDGLLTIKSWRPGVENDQIDDWETRTWCHGYGAEIRRIVAVVDADGSRRILYRRTFRRPDGGEFGKAKVRMTTPSGFTAWLNESSRSQKLRDLQVIVPA